MLFVWERLEEWQAENKDDSWHKACQCCFPGSSECCACYGRDFFKDWDQFWRGVQPPWTGHGSFIWNHVVCVLGSQMSKTVFMASSNLDSGPRWLSKYFCFMPIEVRHVGLRGQELEGQVLRSNDLVYPMPGSLCMGFGWSLYFAQKISEQQMQVVPALRGSSLINDRCGPAVSAQALDTVKHYVYVDNLGGSWGWSSLCWPGSERADQPAHREELATAPRRDPAWDDHRFGGWDGWQEPFHPCCADQVSSSSSRTPAPASERSVHRPGMGDCGWSLHFLRPGEPLRFKYFSQCVQVHQVKLQYFSGALAQCCRWTQGFCGADACTQSAAVLWFQMPAKKGTGSVTLVGSLQRQQTQVGAVKGKVTSGWTQCQGICALSCRVYPWWGDWPLDRWRNWGRRVPWGRGLAAWLRVPRSVSPTTQKLRLASGSPGPLAEIWAHSAAVVRSMEAVVHDCNAFDSRPLLLVDSMSAALAFDRCRSRNYKVLRQLRKFCSYAIGCNLSFSVRWIPSEIIPADKPSRVFDIYHAHGQPSKRPVLRAFSCNGAKQELPHWLHQFPGHPAILLSHGPCPYLTRRLQPPVQSPQPVWWRSLQQQHSYWSLSAPRGSNWKKWPREWKHPGRKGDFRKRRQHLILRGANGSQSTADVGKAQQKAPEEVCRRNERVRAQGHHCQVRAVLQPGVWGAESIHQQSQIHFLNSFQKRCGHQCLFQPSLFGGFGEPSSPQGRKDSSAVHASEPGLQPVWITETASDLSSFEGVAKAEPRHFPQGMAFASVVRSGLRLGQTGTFDDSLVLGSAYLRPWATPLMRHLTGRPSNQMLWDFDYGQYAKVFGQIARQMGIDINPLSASALKSKYRSKPNLQDTTGGTETRKVETTQECGPIREVRKTSSKLSNAPGGLATALPGRRITSRGSDVGPGPRSKKMPSLPKVWRANMWLTCFQVMAAWRISADSLDMRLKNGSCVEGRGSTSQGLQFWAS